MNVQTSISSDRTRFVIGRGGHQTPTSTILIERAPAIAAQVAQRIPEIDSASKLPDGLIRDLRDAELFATLIPRIYGGHELGLETASGIIRTFAAVSRPSHEWTRRVSSRSETSFGVKSTKSARSRPCTKRRRASRLRRAQRVAGGMPAGWTVQRPRFSAA